MDEGNLKLRELLQMPRISFVKVARRVGPRCGFDGAERGFGWGRRRYGGGSPGASRDQEFD